MLKSLEIPLYIQEVGHGLQVWISTVGGKYSQPTVLI